MMRLFFFLGIIALLSCTPTIEQPTTTVADQPKQPIISFTFDDGITDDLAGYQFKDWNQMILDALDRHQLKAVFFSMGHNKLGAKGQFLLQSWNDKGHRIGNHTFSHPYYNSKKVSFEQFKEEFHRGDSMINQLSNYIQLFRFPYLKEGNTRAKVDRFRQLLADHNYQNGAVTIDASDWYIDGRLKKRLNKDHNSDIEAFKHYYLQHLYDRACFYEKLSFELTGRHIAHNILLHHNLTSALFLDDLIQLFKDKGWKCIDAATAFEDQIYTNQPKHVPAGESLIWALAKDKGSYESILRYPAEDSRYEEAAMDSLGL